MEKEWIDRLWQRDETVIGSMEAQYGKLLHRVAGNILGNVEDAEECVNDGLLAVWNRIPPDRPEHLLAYVCRVVKNLALNRLDYNRAAKRDTSRSVSLEALEELGNSLCTSDGALEAVSEDAVRCVLNGFLADLPREMRVVFLRRYWFLDSVKDIAAASGFSESKVKSMLLRCRNRLRAELEREGVEL